MESTSRIYVAGHSGLVGSSLVRRLERATDPDKRHGSYARWSRKIGGKTVSERVKAEHVPLLEEWLGNARELDRLLSEMQQVSLRATRRILGQRSERARRP